jgi:hypothetical protein
MGRLLDEAPGHLAARRQPLAAPRDLGRLWLPKPCAELKAMEQVWRELQGPLSAHYPYPTLDEHAAAAAQWIMARTSTEAPRKAGILSKHCWLKSFLK